MRGSFDFETYGWNIEEGQDYARVNPLCCGLMWGLPDSREEVFIHDTKRSKPDTIPVIVLLEMWKRRNDITEWWAHNMGRFDGLFLCAAATRLGWEIEGRLADSRVIMLTFRPPESLKRVKVFDSYEMVGQTKLQNRHADMQTIRVLDTYNVVPMSLKDCGNDFELPSRKLFNETDYRGDMRELPIERLRAGCMADCRLVLELLECLESQIDQWGGHLKRTFSSSALSIVKSDLSNKGMRLPDFSTPSQRWINEEAGRSYYGGRVEVFHHNPHGWLTDYDVCSSYPYAMAQPLPWEFIERLEGHAALKAYDKREHLIVHANVEVPPQHIPPLPFKPNGDEGSIFFPTGHWEGWFTGEELRYAEEACGVDVEILDVMRYSTENPFQEFISKVYELKRTAKGAVRTFAKLLLNGCYGKFAESPEHEKLKVVGTIEEGLEKILQSEGEVGCAWDDERYLSIKYHSPAKHAHYAIASHITARARVLLHKYLVEADSPAYCDSDSIHCLGWEGETGNNLGQLKVELSDYRGEFFAPKIYRLTERDGKVHLACKGFPVNEKSFAQMYGSAVDLHKWKRTAGSKKPNAEAKKSIRAIPIQRMRLLKSQFKDRGTAVVRTAHEKRWSGLSMKRKPFSDGSTEAWTVDELNNGNHKTAVCPLLTKEMDAA